MSERRFRITNRRIVWSVVIGESSNRSKSLSSREIRKKLDSRARESRSLKCRERSRFQIARVIEIIRHRRHPVGRFSRVHRECVRKCSCRVPEERLDEADTHRASRSAVPRRRRRCRFGCRYTSFHFPFYHFLSLSLSISLDYVSLSAVLNWKYRSDRFWSESLDPKRYLVRWKDIRLRRNERKRDGRIIGRYNRPQSGIYRHLLAEILPRWGSWRSRQILSVKRCISLKRVDGANKMERLSEN